MLKIFLKLYTYIFVLRICDGFLRLSEMFSLESINKFNFILNLWVLFKILRGVENFFKNDIFSPFFPEFLLKNVVKPNF